MKSGIHPTYHRTKVTCASCGAEFEIGSTNEELRVDTCHKCHSFYTGETNFTAKAGRAEKFKERMAAAAEASKADPKAATEVAEEKAEEVDTTKMSLADLAAAVEGKDERVVVNKEISDSTSGKEVKVIKKAKKESKEEDK